jgi:glycosyltransferase involved in cell wall biosynthesis
MDGDRPLVSILVPLYNHAGYIRQCLDSILSDGYPCIEILIIDDGSRDNSVELPVNGIMMLTQPF